MELEVCTRSPLIVTQLQERLMASTYQPWTRKVSFTDFIMLYSVIDKWITAVYLKLVLWQRYSAASEEIFRVSCHKRQKVDLWMENVFKPNHISCFQNRNIFIEEIKTYSFNFIILTFLLSK